MTQAYSRLCRAFDNLGDSNINKATCSSHDDNDDFITIIVKVIEHPIHKLRSDIILG